MTHNKNFAYKAISLTNDFGGKVCRRILDMKIQKTSTPTLSSFLTAKQSTLQNFLNGLNGMPKILSPEQYLILFPNGIAATSAESFDITLLIFLLRAFFYSRNQAMKAKWYKKLSDMCAENTTEVDDLVRVRCYRNKIHDMTDTGTWMNEKEFYQFWGEFTAVLLRLGPTFGLYTLQDEINELLNEPFDVEREKALETLLKSMQVASIQIQTEMSGFRVEMTSKKTDIELLKERSKRELLDVLDDDTFVKTKSFSQIESFLHNNRIVVIKGAQGEGKTTMAKKLVQNPEEFFKLNTYSDWKIVSFGTDIHAYILLDDMFGGGVLDKTQSRKWRKEINAMRAAIDNDELNVYIIITSRSYILEEVQSNPFFEHIINENNTFTISSKELSDAEMTDILTNHLKAVGRTNYNDKLVKKCIKVAGESDWFIGFPECARLFSKHDNLFEMKEIFFKKPIRHIMTCLNQFFEDEKTYLAFYVLWAQSNQTLSLRDLELSLDNTSNSILDPIHTLQFSSNHFLRSILPSLKKHAQKGGFIKYEETTEAFKFSHPVVSDAVGLVICKKNTTAVLAFCSSAFMQNYIRVGPKDSSMNIRLIEDRYDQLCIRIGQLMLPENIPLKGNQSDHAIACSANETAMKANNKDAVITADSSNKRIEPYLKTALLEHPAFKNDIFCDVFTAPHINTMLCKIFSTPVMTVGVELRGLKCLDKNVYESEIHLLAYLFINKKPLLADKCCIALKELENKGKIVPKISEKDFSMSMLMAANTGNSEMIDILIKKGAEIDCNTVYTAIERGEREVLNKLMEKTDGKQLDAFEKNGLNPLMYFVEKGNADAVQLVLATEHVNVNSLSSENETALHKACQFEQADIVEMLLQKGANAKIKDKKGYFPIHTAALGNKVANIRTLLKHDKTQATYPSETVDKVVLFHLAVKEQSLELVNLLIEEDIPLNTVDAKGQTPLLFAVRNKKNRILEKVVEASVKQNAHLIFDNKSNTVLHVILQQLSTLDSHAIKEMYKHIFKILCQSGADIDSKNDDGKTVKDIANDYNLNDVLEELTVK